ncbi:hypothetical protein ABC426_02425 [Lactiplantibacillus plantarum]|uniref:hypothetical protein n=1 Tax=Lactiplantibacillus plantarum TaxID=1590 RepID=UPI001BA7BD4B|nr:hypothetical protein [Lactiplantibacillus plantarum]MBS0951392.1 hypothetical protein [Lactiplantibacillus plantarum]
MQKIITKQRLLKTCFNYLQTGLLLIGLLLLVIGFGRWLGINAALILAGASLIALALLINYEKNRDEF